MLSVTLFQRLCLDVFGMLDYLTTPIPPPSGNFHMALDRWMGTFTTEPEVCQRLFDAGIPVWIVWNESTVPYNINVHKNVNVTRPMDIVMEREDFNVGQVLKWERVQYHGSFLRHMRTREGAAIGIEQFVSPFTEEDTAISSNNSMSAQREITSSGAGVSRTQWSNSHQEPCKYLTTTTFLFIDLTV